jgi:16S rRNA (cytosine1402-N4)-methyltransferase
VSHAQHEPVLLAESLDLLQPRPGGRFVDATVNGGGHACAILDRTAPDGRLLALDADPVAVATARARLEGSGSRATVVHANFRVLGAVAGRMGFLAVDGVLMDLGLSSLQIEAPGRGFSFRRDAPLDMRHDPSVGRSAAQYLGSASAMDLEWCLRSYGEEPRARAIAAEIVAFREKEPIVTSGQLAALVSRVLGGRRGRIHPATRTFQALRIAVNDELGALTEALPQALGLLRSGGRLAVIAFHSLEDRVVKAFFRREAGLEAEETPRGMPAAPASAAPRVRILTRRPIRPSPEELSRNPRARSARLRVAERL